MDKSSRNLQRCLVLVKLKPTKTDSFFNSLRRIKSEPMEGVRLSASHNCSVHGT